MKKIALLIFLIISVEAFACTCINSKIEKSHYDSAELIIKGKVIRVRYDKGNFQKIVTFKIYKTYKGKTNKIIKIRTSISDSNCGLPINYRDKWLLFVRKTNNKYAVSLCGKNVRYNKRPNQSKKLHYFYRKKMKSYIQKIKKFRKLSVINS